MSRFIRDNNSYAIQPPDVYRDELNDLDLSIMPYRLCSYGSCKFTCRLYVLFQLHAHAMFLEKLN